MSFDNPFYNFAFGELFETVVPDFVLAFAFFTSIVYLVVGKRFGQNRTAVALSATLGVALAVGLIWWEQTAGLSIKNLGPIAAGFALILLAGLIYQAIRQVGGNWAGAGISIGACLIVGWILGLKWPVDAAIIQTVMTISLTIGIIAFLSHQKGSSFLRNVPEISGIRHDMDDLYEDRSVSSRLAGRFRTLGREARSIPDRPQAANEIMLQLQRILPVEGWLTQRMARLRERVYHIQRGQFNRVLEIEQAMGKMSAESRDKAAKELTARYKELRLDVRIDRLDKAVTANEQKIKELTRQAQWYLSNNDHRNLADVLKVASKLQRHNSELFKLITQTEKKIISFTQHIARETHGGG